MWRFDSQTKKLYISRSFVFSNPQVSYTIMKWKVTVLVLVDITKTLTKTVKYKQTHRYITALFTNIQILKFKSQLTIAFFTAVNHYNKPLRKQNFNLTETLLSVFSLHFFSQLIRFQLIYPSMKPAAISSAFFIERHGQL